MGAIEGGERGCPMGGAKTTGASGAGGTAVLSSPATPLSPRDGRAVIGVIVAAMMFNGFMVTLMSVALPAVARAYGVTVAQANWVVLVFAIVAATVITMGARLLHRWGLKRLMVVACGCMAAGGIVGFLAVNYAGIMAARVLHACAAGLLYPTASTSIMKAAPPDRRTFSLSLKTAAGGIAASPFLSGLVLTHFGVNAMFLPTAVMGLGCLVASVVFVKPIGERDAALKPIDVPSALLAFVGLGCAMFGTPEINHALAVALPLLEIAAGSGCGFALVHFAGSGEFKTVGAAVLGLFAWRQRGLAVPLLNLRPLANRTFLVGVLLVMFSSFAEHALRLTVPLYLEGAAGFTASAAGLFMLLPQLAYAGSAMVAGKIVDRRGIWPLVPAGFAIIVAGLAALWGLAEGKVVAALLVVVFVILAGVGTETAPNREVALAALDAEALAAGSSISSVFVQLASALSSALLVGFFTNEVAAQTHAGASEAAAYVGGFQDVMLMALAIEAVMLVAAVLYARKHRRARGGR